MEDEMQRYLAEDEAPIGTNILHWWRDIGSTVPSVACSATSASVKRLENADSDSE